MIVLLYRRFNQLQDEKSKNKLRKWIQMEVESHLEKCQHISSNNTSDRLITHLESHILFLEEELKKRRSYRENG